MLWLQVGRLVLVRDWHRAHGGRPGHLSGARQFGVIGVRYLSHTYQEVYTNCIVPKVRSGMCACPHGTRSGLRDIRPAQRVCLLDAAVDL